MLRRVWSRNIKNRFSIYIYIYIYIYDISSLRVKLDLPTVTILILRMWCRIRGSVLQKWQYFVLQIRLEGRTGEESGVLAVLMVKVHIATGCNVRWKRVFSLTWTHLSWCHSYHYTGYTQKNGAVSKVNKKFISDLTRAQYTSPVAATVRVSHALTLRLLMSYTYGAPILDVSRSHTTTQHSR